MATGVDGLPPVPGEFRSLLGFGVTGARVTSDRPEPEGR